nr:MAG TPA: hypothetical protein [Caudovirales sp. ctIiT24]
MVFTNKRPSQSSQSISLMHYIIFDFFTRSRNLFVLNFRILTLYNILQK